MMKLECPNCKARIVQDYELTLWGDRVEVEWCGSASIVKSSVSTPIVDEDEPTEEEKVLLADAKRLHRAGYDERSAQRLNPDPRVIVLLGRILRKGGRR